MCLAGLGVYKDGRIELNLTVLPETETGDKLHITSQVFPSQHKHLPGVFSVSSTTSKKDMSA